jgi:hypothetical protein
MKHIHFSEYTPLKTPTGNALRVKHEAKKMLSGSKSNSKSEKKKTLEI